MPSCAISIPDVLLKSRLMQSGGFEVLPDLLGADLLERVRTEALHALRLAKPERRDRRIMPESDPPTFDGDRRAGARIKRLLARGGPHQHEFYNSRGLIEYLSERAGLRLRPSGSHGVYAYYVRPGDFIGLHRDTGPHDLELVTALYDSSPSGDAGALVLYPARATETCKTIGATLRRGQTVLKLKPGESLFMLGGVIPHRVKPVVAEQARIISTLSYSLS